MNQTLAYGVRAKADQGAADQASLRRELLRLEWVGAVYSRGMAHPNTDHISFLIQNKL